MTGARLDEAERIRRNRFAGCLLVPLSVFLIVLIAVFFVVNRTAYVSGDSMFPQLHSGDRLLVGRGSKALRRGDVVVARVFEGGERVEVVKRIVAVGGDRIETRSDRVVVNGQPEEYGVAVTLLASNYDLSTDPLTLPAGTVYLMGDNRAVSLDSRFYGPIPASNVLGIARAVYSPVTRARLIDRPPAP